MRKHSPHPGVAPTRCFAWQDARDGGPPLTLPPRPDAIEPALLCATSGMAPGPHCPRVHDYVIHGRAPAAPCSWHDAAGRLHYPDKAKRWLARRR